MDISIETYRNRIGHFYTSKHNSYLPEKSRKQSYKSSTKTAHKFRRLVFILVLILSLISRLEDPPVKTPDPVLNLQFRGSLASSTPPVSFFVLGGQDSVTLFPTHHLSFYDVLAVHSAATLLGAQAGPQEKGWIVAALPLQHSILSDIKFYARYT